MGILSNLFGDKNKKQKDQLSVDYVRINLLAKLGEESLDGGNYEAAKEYIQEFFELMDRNSFSDLKGLIQPCLFNLALAFSNLGDHESAVKYWSKFIQGDRGNFDAFFERCKSNFALNKINEAISDINTALSIDPSRSDLHINKGIGFLKLGNKNEARIAFNRALELGNSDAQQYISKYC